MGDPLRTCSLRTLQMISKITPVKNVHT